MKAFVSFSHELNKLTAFYKATTFAYDQAELTLLYRKKNKIPFNEESTEGLKILTPEYFKIKRSAKIEIRKNLNEVVFVRVLSALEVFLVDIIRDIFLATKEPFKRNDLRLELNHAELLSIKSIAEISSKIINKECRKLTSAGYDEIVKYFKRHFEIELDSFAPGKSKIEEYHDRRHLLVHRLGRTDSAFRRKYNYVKNSINIDYDYLFACISDFKEFSILVNSQVEYYLKNSMPEIVKKNAAVERTVRFEIRSCDELPDCFLDDFEFWVDDEFRMLSDILMRREKHNDRDFDLTVSGSFREIKSYLRVIRRNSKKGKFQYREITEFVKTFEKGEGHNLIKIVDNEILEKVKNELPEQPWEKGIHKIIASKLGTTNKVISIAIQQLIATKVFKPQIDGVLLEHEQ